MARVTTYHLTPLRNLPLIEDHGLRTRLELTDLLGPIGEFDKAAPDQLTGGRRVSAFINRDHAAQRAADLGAGLVEFTVDPNKAIAVAGEDPANADAYWKAATTLAEAGGADAPADTHVHVAVAVRPKHSQILAPLVGAEQLGDFEQLVNALADTDRAGAKAVMHVALVASEADFDSPAFAAACALAWRDKADPRGFIEKIVSGDIVATIDAALESAESDAPTAVAELRAVMDAIETEAAGQYTVAQGLLAKTSQILASLPAARVASVR